MEEKKNTLVTFTKQHIVPAIVTVYVIIAALIYLAVPVLAQYWLQTPFLGAFVEHSMVFIGAGPERSSAWEPLALDENPLTHQLLTINAQPVSNSRDLQEILREYKAGETVTLTTKSITGLPTSLEVELQTFPAESLAKFIYIPYGVGLIFLISAIWVYLQRRSTENGRPFVVFATSVAILTGSLFDLYTTHYLTYFWCFALVIIGASSVDLALAFPQKIKKLEHHVYLQWIGYIPAWGLFFYILPSLYNTSRPFAYLPRWQMAYIFSTITIVLFFGVSIYRRYTSPSPAIRQQAQAVLWGAIFSFSPVIIWIVLQSSKTRTVFSPLLFLPLGIFPLVVSYIILRYRILRADIILQQSILYTLLTVLIGGGYAAIVSGVSILAGEAISPRSPLLVGGLVLFLAVTLNPLRDKLQKLLEVAFFRSRQAYQDYLQEFTRNLTDAIKIQDIVVLLRETINQSLSPQPLHIYIYDPVREDYGAGKDEEDKPTTDIRFSANGALAQTLANQKVYLYIQNPEECPEVLRSDYPRMSITRSQLFVPIPGREEHLLGWFALGVRRSGEQYSAQIIDFLESLSDQAALALERAQVVSNLERRVDEMNIFARVAQGVNITPSFDDVLELIYAQTVRLIPAQDFFITLYDEKRDSFSYVFYLEDDMRLLEHENITLETESLAQLIARQNSALVTNDYEQESYSHNIAPMLDGVYAWMGVPLNVGSETIGSLSLGSRDLAVVYTEAQRDLLQSIADQTAGAITKARLLREMQRRARQLNTLNEVARKLTSTLELSPLLYQILESAAEILDAEAGTLFLVDENTKELIFEVVIGPVANELVGTRLPAGTGHVGRSVDTGQASIITNVHLTEEWAKEPDKETGFQTRDLLIAPLELKGKIIGVIELINKRDGSVFNLGDQELLTSFASQAAIAFDNARLYTQTDQALAARVEELSIMQEIDQELNASLDVERAMQITLQQALRQVEADAGFVGIVREEHIQIMTYQGYEDELDQYYKNGMPLDLPYFQQALTTGKLQQKLNPEDEGLLTDAQCYISVPISLEADVIGILILERKQANPWEKDNLDFLSRLSDHAAISIANAQLYAEVQDANIAKSEFVSFVSHELKTPMTSIRGYADLLLKGAVGEINENQESFLQTIRGNVNRMAILVSDLADISRIESGRLQLDFKAIAPEEVVNSVVRSLNAQIEGKNQILKIQISKNIPPVWGDQVRLIQILTNLLSNAYKYTPAKGEISIIVERTKNLRDKEIADEVVRFSVVDTGTGIPEEAQPKIFSKFFRTIEAQSGESPGTGLGLNITRNLVEMQNGQIWFESVHGEGSAFHFTIPIAETA